MMSEETKVKLRILPRVKCKKCGKAGCYTNPLVKCFECKNKFHSSCIYCLQIKEGMEENDKARNICESCKKKYGYYRL